MNGMIAPEIRADSRMKKSHFLFFCRDKGYTIDRLCRCSFIEEPGNFGCGCDGDGQASEARAVYRCHAMKFPRLEKFRGHAFDRCTVHPWVLTSASLRVHQHVTLDGVRVSSC